MAKDINTINSINAKFTEAQKHFDELDGLTDALDTNKADVTQAAWVEATLLNNFTGSIKYRKNTIGQIELVVSGTIGATVAAGTILCTLPAGFRPLVYFDFRARHGASVLDLLFGTDGNVTLNGTGTNGNALNGVGITV